jgi:hypothetical protein
VITINSGNGWFRAVLDETEDGIAIAIWAKTARGADALWKPVHRSTLDVVFHVACTRVLDLLNQLEAGQSKVPPRPEYVRQLLRRVPEQRLLEIRLRWVSINTPGKSLGDSRHER